MLKQWSHVGIDRREIDVHGPARDVSRIEDEVRPTEPVAIRLLKLREGAVNSE
jgi:hypothetical protein